MKTGIDLIEKVRAKRKALGLCVDGACFSDKVERDWYISRAVHNGRTVDVMPRDFSPITPAMIRQHRDIIVLARAFAAELLAEIGADKLRAAAAENRRRNDATCASHDYCDANMPMAAAFEKVTGRPLLPDDEPMTAPDLARVNAAWSFAKAAGFFVD